MFIRETYILSLISSRRFISFLASCCLRYSGETVTAVTWPCHDSPCPSTLPITEKTIQNHITHHNSISNEYDLRSFYMCLAPRFFRIKSSGSFSENPQTWILKKNRYNFFMKSTSSISKSRKLPKKKKGQILWSIQQEH